MKESFNYRELKKMHIARIAETLEYPLCERFEAILVLMRDCLASLELRFFEAIHDRFGAVSKSAVFFVAFGFLAMTFCPAYSQSETENEFQGISEIGDFRSVPAKERVKVSPKRKKRAAAKTRVKKTRKFANGAVNAQEKQRVFPEPPAWQKPENASIEDDPASPDIFSEAELNALLARFRSIFFQKVVPPNSDPANK